MALYLFPSLFQMKCPRGREGNVFKDPNPYHLKHLGAMNDLCPVCQLNFRPEPGFYFGGAMVSYPLKVIFCSFVTLAFYHLFDDVFHHIPEILLTLLIAALVVASLFFRYSRIIFLYILIRFNKEK